MIGEDGKPVLGDRFYREPHGEGLDAGRAAAFSDGWDACNRIMWGVAPGGPRSDDAMAKRKAMLESALQPARSPWACPRCERELGEPAPGDRLRFQCGYCAAPLVANLEGLHLEDDQ